MTETTKAGASKMAEKKLGRASRKKKKDFIIVIDDKYISDPDKLNEMFIINPERKAKGGRAGLKGGGICKRGMNRQAIGKNS